MVGRAMFTTVMSRMIMSWAPSTMARAIPRRSSRRAPPRPPSVVIRAIDDVDMNAFLCCLARLRGALAVPLRLAQGPGRGGNVPRPGLRWLPWKWRQPPVTIRRYPPLCNSISVRADEYDRRARPGGRRIPGGRRLPGGFRAIGVWGVPRGHSVPPGKHGAPDARGRAAQLRA